MQRLNTRLEFPPTHEERFWAKALFLVIDCCKIVSAQAKSDEDIWENEIVKKKFPTEFIPMGAIVTASGTGSEMNAGAVITNEAEKIKFQWYCKLNQHNGGLLQKADCGRNT